MRSDYVRDDELKRKCKILAEVRDSTVADIVADIVEKYFNENKVELQRELTDFMTRENKLKKF